MGEKIWNLYNFFLKIANKMWFVIRSNIPSLFETKREAFDFFLGGYAWIFLIYFFYVTLTEVFPSEARQYSREVFMAWLGLTPIFVTIGMVLTMGLSIYYLYRAGRAIYPELNHRETIPNFRNPAGRDDIYEKIREIEEDLSSWKGRDVSELIALIGEPERKTQSKKQYPPIGSIITRHPHGCTVAMPPDITNSYVWSNVEWNNPVSTLRSLVFFSDYWGTLEFYLWTCDDPGWRDPFEGTLPRDMESRGEVQ